jgi:hypothetical protein
VNARSKLAAFGLVLAAALGLGALAGNIVGPISANEDGTGGDGGDRGHEAAGAAPASEADDEVGAATVDGYEVTLTGTPVAGPASELGLTVRRDGRPVTDLDPYPGAFGHLVVIRSGDLAPLHVQPVGDEPSAGDRGGPEVAFTVDVPSPGEYRLLFDFSRGGTVRTAAFTVQVAADATPAADAPSHAGAGAHG